MIEHQIMDYLKKILGLTALTDEEFIEELEKKPLLKREALKLFNDLKVKYKL